MQDFIKALESEFILASNPDIAKEQKAYLRDQFEFYGIKTPERRKITKPFLIRKYLPPKSDLEPIVRRLWVKPQREYRYFAQELAYRYAKDFEINDIELFEYMITHQSWWDTVDFIATNVLSDYFKYFPNQIQPCVDRWLQSDNIWLQRSALLFQLKWKEDLDQALLTDIILHLNGTDEFFINKAIGWVLCQYSKTDPDWVWDFVEANELSALSRKEALRLLK